MMKCLDCEKIIDRVDIYGEHEDYCDECLDKLYDKYLEQKEWFYYHCEE